MDVNAPDFEHDDEARSSFVRGLILDQLERAGAISEECQGPTIPQTLVRYWHNLKELPEDVRQCLDSWEGLRAKGFEIRTYDDLAAKLYIADTYGPRELEAFGRCRHPAMRSDYFRMCFILAEGGMYVDADDVLIGDSWKSVFRDRLLKLQPLCYDIPSSRMVPSAEIWRAGAQTTGRIFYVNNDPLAAPPGHPLIARALARSTAKLLGPETLPIIQATTGPGNMSVAFAMHAHALRAAALPPDFELLCNWDEIAEMRWDLSYRGDDRNWRNVEGSGF